MKRLGLARAFRYQMSGFSPEESVALKQIPLYMPYSKLMRRDRIRLINQANKENWTKTKLQRAIALQYEARGWKSKGERLTKSVIYRMVRWYQQQWRDSASPDDIKKFVSPSAKTSHHGNDLNHQKLLRQKREYNSRPEVREKRRLYRLRNRDKIRAAEKQRRQFKSQQERFGR